jgi:hypothetical protein
MKGIHIQKESGESEGVNPLEFHCQAPLKFYEHCTKCPRFGDDCPYLRLGLELFLKEKHICYHKETN